MADTAKTKKKALIVSDFSDAGTGEQFIEGTTPMIETGAFENYKAAGLIRPATADEAKAKPADAAQSHA